MTRKTYIEQIRRLIYNGQPSDDATITVGLVNTVLNQAIGIAAQKNWNDSIVLDGVQYVNGGFYSTYKNLTIYREEYGLFRIELPHVPIGLGADMGVATCTVFDGTLNSYPIAWLTQNQRTFARGMRQIPNTLLGYLENKNIYIESVFPLTSMTAKVTMISGGDSTDLSSTLNVPDDYIDTMTQYLVKYFMLERMQPVDNQNDGEDFVTTT